MKFSNWSSILLDKLSAWWVALISILPNLIVALVVAVMFVFLARFTKSTIYKVMPRINGKRSINNLFSNIAYLLVLFLGLFLTLNILNLNQAVSSLIAGAGIIGLVLGFAFQDLSSNFISGVIIAIKKPFEVGHTIETNGYMGNIEDIQLRMTIIRTFQGLHLMIPNKDIFQKPLINYSRSDDRRIELEFTVAMEYDPAPVMKLCKDAVDQLEYIVKTKPVEVYYTGFGDNNIKLAVWFWIFNHKPPGFMIARSEAITNIIASLNQHAITLNPPVIFMEHKKEENRQVKDKAVDNHQNANI